MSDFEFDKGQASDVVVSPDVGDEDGPGVEVIYYGADHDLALRIASAVRTVYDPEIPVNVYDLGLIYTVEVEKEIGRAKIAMTLTAPGCPVAGSMPGMVRDAVQGNVPELTEVEVELVWDPPWAPDRMSEAARLELGLF